MELCASRHRNPQSFASPAASRRPIPPRLGQTPVAAGAASRTLSTSSGRRRSHRRQPDPSDDRTAFCRCAPALGAAGEQRARGSRPAQSMRSLTEAPDTCWYRLRQRRARREAGPNRALRLCETNRSSRATSSGDEPCPVRRHGHRQALRSRRPPAARLPDKGGAAARVARGRHTRSGSPARIDGARRSAAAGRPGRRAGVCRSHG